MGNKDVHLLGYQAPFCAQPIFPSSAGFVRIHSVDQRFLDGHPIQDRNGSAQAAFRKLDLNGSGNISAPALSKSPKSRMRKQTLGARLGVMCYFEELPWSHACKSRNELGLQQMSTTAGSQEFADGITRRAGPVLPGLESGGNEEKQKPCVYIYIYIYIDR